MAQTQRISVLVWVFLTRLAPHIGRRPEGPQPASKDGLSGVCFAFGMRPSLSRRPHVPALKELGLGVRRVECREAGFGRSRQDAPGTVLALGRV